MCGCHMVCVGVLLGYAANTFAVSVSALGPMLYVCALLSGLYVRHSNMSAWIAWFWYINPGRCYVELISATTIAHRTFACATSSNSTACEVTGEQAMQQFSYSSSPNNIAYAVVLIFALTIVARLLALRSIHNCIARLPKTITHKAVTDAIR